MAKRRTIEEYLVLLEKKNPNIELVGNYSSSQVPTLHRCKLCNYMWNTRPNNLLLGHSCPVCATPPRVAGPAPEYKNSIWASKYKNIALYYGLSEELMKTTLPMSTKKIDICCPNCGQARRITTSLLFTDGLSCKKCSDGISYPEKFIAAILDQLNILYEAHQTFSWSNKKEYDFFLPQYNCIIEAHGLQHFEDVWVVKSADEQKQNDVLKETLAKDHGILYYFQIDCRNSNADWIRTSLIDSGVLLVLGITEDSINWEQCSIDALNSKVKTAALLWNTGYSVKKIAEDIRANRRSVKSWLYKAALAGLCDYSTQVSCHRGRDEEWRNKIKHSAAWQSRMIVCVETGTAYSSMHEASRQLSIRSGNISRSVNSEGRLTAEGLHFIKVPATEI